MILARLPLELKARIMDLCIEAESGYNLGKTNKEWNDIYIQCWFRKPDIYTDDLYNLLRTVGMKLQVDVSISRRFKRRRHNF
jgi:hypothetical protein